MKDWKHIPLRALLAAMARMPFWMLYGISDLLFPLIRYLARYRVKIVKRNLLESFPEKSPKERGAILREFYRNFADYIVETIKLGHISDAQIRRRLRFENARIMDDLLERGKSIAIYFSHCGNWEWATSVTLWSRLRPEADAVFAQVYRPLRSKWFDAYLLQLRGRFRTRSLQKRTVLRDLVRLKRDNIPSMIGFLSDQKPSAGDTSHVVTFLNHPTAVITGTEQLARKLDMAVVYWDMSKLGRGRYVINAKLITDDISSTAQMSVTDCYIRMLEQTIRRNPSIWLWSHNRWKNKVELPV